MIEKTSESAVQALLYLGSRSSREPMPSGRLAQELELSPTSLAKVSRMLTKAGLLVSHKGARGGVTLARPPRDINLLEIVEACQGLVARNYCHDVTDTTRACSYHLAMVDLRESIREALSRWTLESLLKRPASAPENTDATLCVMASKALVDISSKGRDRMSDP
ncbi:MAG: Rrf2 family transcriptional regulator [Thermoanaerobaculia bacterium]|nr:Rrf2 family transcriptional regulator [Thermoanaerobaculia bacterium]